MPHGNMGLAKRNGPNRKFSWKEVNLPPYEKGEGGE
jgi:hypothetical protein